MQAFEWRLGILILLPFSKLIVVFLQVEVACCVVVSVKLGGELSFSSLAKIKKKSVKNLGERVNARSTPTYCLELGNGTVF